jgi:hypothetical protein
MKSIKIYGYSVGDSSVGIGTCHFEIDTGLIKLNKEDKDFLINGVVKEMWELHDNGNIKFDFSDEMNENDFDYKRDLSYELKRLKVLEEKE